MATRHRRGHGPPGPEAGPIGGPAEPSGGVRSLSAGHSMTGGPLGGVTADLLLLITEVPNLYVGYGTPDREAVLDVTPTESRAAWLPDNSMGPEAEAGARFVENTGGLAAVGPLDAACEIVHGRSGPLVRPDLPVVRGA
ncbi:hypothetical protein ABZ835_43720 [Streptomyces sp. NPDC047461]|uniref:hypothetical protein n=1 Tax=Streptomyces sp. NPDC047461 TaxID=3155619 RepID=UPI0033C532AC